MADWRKLAAFDRIDVGDGLVLRRLGHQHADDFLRMLREDPGIGQRVKVAAGVQSVADFGDVVEERIGGPEAVRWMVEDRGQVVGYLNLWRAGELFPGMADPDDHGFGYFLAPGARGRGVIHRVLDAAMDVAQAQLPVHSFIAFCEDDNPASSRNLVKAGLLPTPTTFVNSLGWTERLHRRPMPPRSAWRNYNAAQHGRPVRSLAVAAARAAGKPAGRHAVELGCGAGIEAAYLAELGWQVHTFDADLSVVAGLAELESRLPVSHVRTRLQDIESLPDCDLLLACFSVPFCPRAAFASLWQTIVSSLGPDGLLAVDLFGDRDQWASDGDGTYLTRDEVEQLLSGFQMLELTESEHDGTSFSGPKHWHTYRILARREPAGPRVSDQDAPAR